MLPEPPRPRVVMPRLGPADLPTDSSTDISTDNTWLDGTIAPVTASQAAAALRTLVATASTRNVLEAAGDGAGDGTIQAEATAQAKAEAQRMARTVAKEVGVVRAEVGALLSDLLCRSGGLEAVLDSYVGSLGAATISEDGAVAAVENLSRLLSRTPTVLTTVDYISLIGNTWCNHF